MFTIKVHRKSRVSSRVFAWAIWRGDEFIAASATKSGAVKLVAMLEGKPCAA